MGQKKPIAINMCIDGYQYVFVFIVLLGTLYNSNFRFYLRASRCTEGSTGSLPLVIFLNEHINKTHPLYILRPVPYISNGTPWTVVPSMHGTHCKLCSLIYQLVSNNNLALLRYAYMCAETLVHIPRHLSKTSNNNKRCQ